LVRKFQHRFALIRVLGVVIFFKDFKLAHYRVAGDFVAFLFSAPKANRCDPREVFLIFSVKFFQTKK
jgi:hypothetical protein